MGSLTNFPIDQVDSIGVDIEVNNLSDEHFRDVMEELTNHQIPEREKCPLVRRLNASISGYFKSTGDVGFSKMNPNNNKGNGDRILTGNYPGACGNNVIGGARGLDDSNSIELVEYRRTFELKNYHSPKSSNQSDIKSKPSESKGSDGSNSSSVPINTSSSSANSCKIPDSSLTSNLNQNGSSVDSFVNFDSLKRPPSEPTSESMEDASLNNNSTTKSNVSINSAINPNLTAINTNNLANDNNKDVSKDNSNSPNNNNSTSTSNNNSNNKGNRSSSNSKTEKKKKSKKGETVYTAQDIDGHIGDQSIDDLVYYVTGNKGEIGTGNSGGVTSGITMVGSSNGSGIVGICGNNGGSVCGPSPSENKLTTNSKNNKDGNSGGKVKKKEKSSSSPTSSSVNSSTSIQGRNKKGSNNSSNTTISAVNHNFNYNSNNFNNANSSVNCASTNGNASDNDVKNFGNKYEKIICSVDSGLGKSIPRSSSATIFDSKFSPSNVAQCEVNSSLDASSTSPILTKSHSTESSSATSMQLVTKIITGTGIVVKSKVKEFDSNKQSNINDGLKNKESDTSNKITTANGDLENSYMEPRYAASDSEMADQETSFQTVKSKHLKRRKGVSRNKGDLRMSSPLPRSSNHIFTNSSSSTSTTPSVTSSTSNSVNTSMTARGYESEREYCADEYRRRKEYLNHRKLASSMPHSEQNSADNSDMESSCSYPVSGRMPILPTPPGPPAASSNSISSTPKVSYADIAKMGSVIGVTPSIGVAKGTQSTNVTLNNSKSDNNNNSCSGKDDNNNIDSSNISGSADTSTKTISTVDSGLSTSIQTNSNSTSCSPYFNSSPNCISPSGLSSPNQPEGSKTVKNNQINKSFESSIDATLSKENPPTIKSENNFDQANSSKDGKTISSNSSNQNNLAAVAIRPKNFNTSKETKMENQKVINEDNSNNNNRSKNDKKMEKDASTAIISTATTITSCVSANSSDSKPSKATTVSTIVTKNASKSSISSSSKTLKALLSPPAEKTPTFDMKKENNKLSDSKVASIKSDTSRALMLKKSNSIPGASVKNDSFRVESNEPNNSISTNHPKLPSSLPPVIMNDDSDAVDEVESPFTFGFFDDVTSSNSSSNPGMNMSFVSKSTVATTKASDSVVMSKLATAKSPSLVTETSSTSVNNKTNHHNTSFSNVKSLKIASTSTPAHSTAATIINSVTNLDSSSLDASKSSEAQVEAPQDRKISDKGSKSSSESTSLEKFIAIKLAEPPTNMDADTNTFNYSQIINFIKTAWESVLCQYQRSPDKNNSRSSTKGANLFHESTTYYKELIFP